jgi:urease subunit gamma
MNLTPKEQERMTVFVAAEIARRRKERDIPLNHPETIAYITDWCNERAREGQSVTEIREEAAQLLSREDVRDGVPEMLSSIKVEPVFPDGTKLVTVHDPIRTDTETHPAYDDAEEERPDEADTRADRDDSAEAQPEAGESE